MDKITLTDRKLKSLKPATTGARYEIMDTEVAGFGVRVSGKGKRTFILFTRYPGSTNPTRREIGEYPTLDLAAARDKARAWRELIRQGIDPKVDEERKRREELRKQADTFEAVAEEFIHRVLIGRDPDRPKQRRGHIVAAELRREFCSRWKGRPIASIDRRDVVGAINKVIDRGATYQAHNLLGHVRAMFNWAIEVGDYGIEHSPCDRIRPKVLIGERKPRQRVLSDAEIAAFWSTTERMGYPFGPLLRLLLLTGARLSEIAGASWAEVDTDQKVLRIPASRFKSDAAHIIPLTAGAIAILDELPRFNKGDHLFSTTFGSVPVSGFSKAKARLDKLMAAELGGVVQPFRTHDLRRTVRTRLASLRVADTVAEMVIGHGRKGIQRVYDQHQYLHEMREALDLWAARLRSIIEPPPASVVELKAVDR